MDAPFVALPTIEVIGRRRRFTPETRPDISAFWDEVLPLLFALQEPGPMETYGICMNGDDLGGFDYLVCTTAKDLAGVENNGLECATIPGAKYAKYTHHGPVTELPSFIASLWSTIVPHIATIARTGMGIEYYGKDWNPTEGPTDIFIPVE